jgi:hypothetical protein
MKYIYKNIKSFVQNNILFFCLFIICQITSFIVLLFSFGAFQNFKIIKNQTIEQTSFEICFGNLIEQFRYDDGSICCTGDGSVDNGSVKKLLDLLDEKTLEELELIVYFPYFNNTNLKFAEGYDHISVAFRLKYLKDEKTLAPYGSSSVSSGVPLTYEEFMQGSNKITLPCDYSQEYLGADVIIADKHYVVCGIETMDDFIGMSYFNSPNDIDGIENISFYFNDLATKSAYYAYIPKIETVSSDKLPFYNSIMAVSVLLALLSAVTLMLLYKYVLQKRSRTIAILRLNGCSKGKSRRICIAEIIIISLICAAIAYALYFGFLIHGLSHYLIYIKAVYSAKNIAVMFAVNVFAAYMVTNIMIVRQLSAKPVDQLKER